MDPELGMVRMVQDQSGIIVKGEINEAECEQKSNMQSTREGEKRGRAEGRMRKRKKEERKGRKEKKDRKE